MTVSKNIIIKRDYKNPLLVDVFYNSNNTRKPIIIFCHGYKGFKDWGAWNIMAKTFAKANFCFIKFNFSHNGSTIEQPIDFPDLEAFANNNYTKELDDLDAIISWVKKSFSSNNEVNTSNISLLGHSRGGGIVSIKAEENLSIKNCITLAGVSDFKARFNENSSEFEVWKKSGVKFVENGRTKQQMPHYFQFYEDFVDNEKRLTIKRAITNLKIPHLIIHGNDDPAVSVEEAKALHKWNSKSKLKIIEGANHVFGTSHPWKSNNMSNDLQKAVALIIAFLK